MSVGSVELAGLFEVATYNEGTSKNCIQPYIALFNPPVSLFIHSLSHSSPSLFLSLSFSLCPFVFISHHCICSFHYPCLPPHHLLPSVNLSFHRETHTGYAYVLYNYTIHTMESSNNGHRGGHNCISYSMERLSPLRGC